MATSTCALCSSVIFDKYILKVRDTLFHQACLFCCVCQMPLTHTCFFRDNAFFCKTHYDKAYRMKCSRCQSLLFPHDLVMRGPECSVFHVHCFNCSVCGYHLRPGDEYVHQMRDNDHELVCGLHLGPGANINTAGLAKAKHDDDDNNAKNNNNDNKDNKDNVAGLRAFVEVGDPKSSAPSRDGRRGPKRPRTILTAMQRRQFKASFEVSPKPCRKVREALAKETGLSVRVVQVWFQNQRAKMKKMQRRGTTMPNEGEEGNNGGNNGNRKGNRNQGGNNETKMTSEPEESIGSDECSSDDEVASFDMASEELAMDMTFAPITEASNMTGNMTSNMTGNNMSSNNMSSNNMSSTTLMQSNPNCNNPIDKLYHMQDSFFTQ